MGGEGPGVGEGGTIHGFFGGDEGGGMLRGEKDEGGGGGRGRGRVNVRAVWGKGEGQTAWGSSRLIQGGLGWFKRTEGGDVGI